MGIEKQEAEGLKLDQQITLRGSPAKSGPFNFASDKCLLLYFLH